MKNYKSFIYGIIIFAIILTTNTTSRKISSQQSLSKNGDSIEKVCQHDRDYGRDFAKKFIQKNSNFCRYSSIDLATSQVKIKKINIYIQKKLNSINDYKDGTLMVFKY